MNILITGSEGNIGKFLVRDIKAAYPGAVLVRVSGRQKIKSAGKNDLVYGGDLCDAALVKKIFTENKIDYVIHAAGYPYHPEFSLSRPFTVLSNDLMMLANVLQQCAQIKKFIYLSSATVYESVKDEMLREQPAVELPFPQSAYGQAKYLGEQLLNAYSRQYGINYTIWRLFNVVSPYESHQGGGGHVFVDFYRKIFMARMPEIKIFGNGKQIRCFTWAEDVTAALAGFLTDAKTDKEIFNLGSSEQKNLLALIDLYLALGKSQKLLPEDYAPKIITGETFAAVDTQVRIPDVSKAHQILGWNAKTDFENCFKQFITYKSSHAD